MAAPKPAKSEPKPDTEYKQLLEAGSKALCGFVGQSIPGLYIEKPADLARAVHLGKVVSKLSPFLTNLMEYDAIVKLNAAAPRPGGAWIRQDPGFPDLLYQGPLAPKPGIEMKLWYPLATEVTARFKDSVSHFVQDQVNVLMFAWLPSHVIYGRPYIVDCWYDSARSVAEARDSHYHKPPGYLVIEPGDTAARKRNLQQTNTAGYKFQGTAGELKEAAKDVAKWGEDGSTYCHKAEYQAKILGLMNKYKYRLDTNFGKMDRVVHTTLEQFKTRVLDIPVHGRPIGEWDGILRRSSRADNQAIIEQLLRGGPAQESGLFGGCSGPAAR